MNIIDDGLRVALDAKINPMVVNPLKFCPNCEAKVVLRMIVEV